MQTLQEYEKRRAALTKIDEVEESTEVFLAPTNKQDEQEISTDILDEEEDWAHHLDEAQSEEHYELYVDREYEFWASEDNGRTYRRLRDDRVHYVDDVPPLTVSCFLMLMY